MNKRGFILLLLIILLVCLLLAMSFLLQKTQTEAPAPAEEVPVPPSAVPGGEEAAEALAGLIQADASTFPEVVVPSDASLSAGESETIVASEGSTLYAYEGMTVQNDGGTVYSTGATVTNYGGTVFCNGGTVYNYSGTVYAKAGTVLSSSGTVYNGGADIVLLPGDKSQESRICGYYELKLAGYYEPYVSLEGVLTEPGSEMMVISEDSICHILPREGYRIVRAETEAGELIRDEADGSIFLVNVDGDTVLTLEIESTAEN